MDPGSRSDPAHLEALLGEREWLARLARHLLGEGPDADDLTQETISRALGSARPRGRAQSWLATIARNLLAEQRRGEARRRARERAVARPEGGGDAGDPLERAALRRALLDEVLALPEPERGAVVLRHLEGLSYAEVAARTGASPATARKRASRGIERLRAQLDRRAGGRQGWAVALGSLVARDVAPAVAPTSSLTGAFAMGTYAKLSLALVALAACFVLAWLARDPRGSVLPGLPSPSQDGVLVAEPTPPGRAPADRGLADATGRADAAPLPPLAAFPRRADSRVGTLELQVSWSDGTPASGVGARLLPWGASDAFLHQRSVTTDENGLAEVDQLAPGKLGLWLDRGGLGAVEILAGRRARAELVLPPGATVRGRVLDPTGEPVAEAVVCLSGGGNPSEGVPVGRSDGEGRYEVRDVSGGPHFSARSPRFAPSDQVYVPLVAGTVVELDLALRGAAGGLRGIVRSSDGRPIAGARVRLTGAIPFGWQAPEDDRFREGNPLPFDLRTDEQGRFASDEVGAGACLVEARAEDRVPASRLVTIPAGGEAVVEVGLARGAVLEGVVRRADGSPAPEATVSHGAYGRFGTLRARVAADGSYRLAGVPPGRFAMRAAERGHGALEAELAFGEGASVRWDATLVEGETVLGAVVDERGAPLAGWFVGDRDGSRSCRTDEAGSFALTDLGRRVGALSVGPPDWHEIGSLLDVPVSLPPREPLRIVVPDALRPSASLRLRLLVDGRPAPASASVALARTGRERARWLRPDAQGLVRFERVGPGDYQLTLASPGRAERRLRCSLGANEERDLGDVSIPVGGRVHLVLTGEGAESCFSARLLDPTGESVGFISLEDGRGTSKLVEPGPVRVRVASFRSAWATVETCVVEAETVEVSLGLQPGTVRAAVVRMGDLGRIPTGTSVRLFDEAGEFLWGHDGVGHSPEQAYSETVFLQGLGIGCYRVEVEARDGRRGEAWLDVTDLEPRTTPELALVLE